MSREVLSYSDISYDSSTRSRQSSTGHPKQSPQPPYPQHHHHNNGGNRGRGHWHGRGNGNGRGRGGGYGGHEAGAGALGGGGRVDHGEDDGRSNKRRRKFEESSDHDRVHWDAQGQKRQGDIEVNYDEVTPGTLHSVSNPVAAAREKSGSQQMTNGGGSGGATKTQTVNLTSGDAWDDTDLISAWDAAIEEYHILNGPEKDWKTEPVHKNSIWYSTSERMKWRDVTKEPEVPTVVASAAVEVPQQDEIDDAMFDSEDEGGAEDGNDDAQLAITTDDQYKTAISTLPDISNLSQDEIFQKAVEASYWAGYWAAAYRAKTGDTQQKALTSVPAEADD
ncbi:hypothetical protein FRB95_010420 [Tulasnella sp. JGI-2019a]|nr:hypothetical protein FRB95_010420 [Tulasnella sp. JGI-2019a]